MSFPQDACTDTDNCVFDHTGRVTRRLGFDTESSYTTDSVSASDGDIYATFVWESVAGDGNTSFFVVQQAGTIKFYDISSSTNISGNKHSTEITLSDYLVSESDYDPADYLCQFSYGDGKLFVVNAACEPFYVTYNPNNNTLTATSIEILVRDFEGLDDGLDVRERPTSTVSGMETNYPNHYYNLLNQGWFGTDALSQWDAGRTDMPSNADYIALCRNDNTDAFANNVVTANEPGNRPAPKGHFILNAFNLDRQTALSDAGYSFAITDSSSGFINSSTGTIFTDFDTSTSAAFDDDIDQTSSLCASKATATTGYIGKDFSSDTKTINSIEVYPSSDVGFSSVFNPNISVTLYANTSTPASGTDGDNLGTTGSFQDVFASKKTILSSDTTTAYRYVWAYITSSDSGTLYTAEVQIYSSVSTFDRPSTVAFYAGRVFYGGINSEGFNNNIYFSQIIEDESQYGKCYQENDPTSEHFPDLLPDDGGYIKIPDMGSLKKLYSYQNALLVFASNGIWIISGSSGSNFKADDYQVKKISSIGMNSPNSLISIKGLPAWWGEDGIYTVTFDPNYDSFSPKSLTIETIDTFYQNIPLNNKIYVKGTYDDTEQVAYWIYSSDSSLGTDKYDYDSVLVMDARTNAFYTWTLSSGPTIRSMEYIKAADRSSSPVVKLMLHRNYTGSAADETFGEYGNTNYLDWEEEGTNVSYDSYFVTGYQLDGQTQKFFQPNYIFVFLDQETNASCYIQGVFDASNTAGSGKWSSQQQIYNENLLNRDINFRRLKIRGKGRMLQLRFESEDQKPFTILGWSIFETVNTNL